jgi:hypothetical protein
MLAAFALAPAFMPAAAQKAYDSAGIRVNDYRSPGPPPPELRLTLLKEFSGGPDSATMTAYSTAMLRLSDGRIAVAVNPPRQPSPPRGSPPSAFRLRPDAAPARTGIRLYDSSGRYIRTIGKAGAGTGGRDGGQFTSSVTRLVELPGSRIAAGQTSYRWFVFTNDGDVVYAPPMAPPSMYGALSDGSVLLGTRGVDAGSDVFVEGSHFAIGTVAFHSVDPVTRHGKPISLTSRFPSMYLPPADADGWIRAPHLPYPVRTSPHIVAGNDVLWTVDVLKWEARAHDRDGRLLTIVRMPIPKSAVNARFGVRYPADSVRESRIVADDLGRFWIDAGEFQYSSPNGPFSRVWAIYERDGRLVHSVTMPEGFYPFHFGRDFVIGRRGDAVALYSMR